jgi:outer membrane protein
MMKQLSFILLGFLLSLYANADTPQVVHSLAETARLALLHDPRTANSAARLQQSSAGVDIAKAGYHPAISIAGSIGRSHYDANNFPKPYRTPNAIELNISQPLYDFGRTSARVNAATAQLHAASVDDTATELEVIRDATMATLQVDLAHKRLDTERNNARVLAKRLDYTRSKFHLGDFTYTDVAQAQARYADARARTRAAQATLTQAQAQLGRLTGAPLDVMLSQLPHIAIPSSLAQALKLIQSNPALQASNYRLAASREQVAHARAKLLPRFELIGALGHDDDTRFSTEPTAYWYTELRLSIPLYNRGSNRAAVRQALATVDQNQAQQMTLARYLTQQVRNAWADLAAAKDEIAAAQEQERATTQALHGIEAELEAGTRTIVDLLDAQQAVLNAKLTVLNVHSRAIISRLELSAAVGQLDLASLNQ